MNSPERHHDMKFLLAGIALLLSGLIFLGASIGIYTLDSHFTQGVLALLAGFGFMAAARMQSRMTWAWIPAGLFLIYGVKQLIVAWRPGAQFMPTLVIWALAVGFLLAFRPSSRRWWPIIPVGVLFFAGVEIGIEQFGVFGNTEGPIVLLYGLALTFFAVHLVNRKMNWPLIVAGAMGLIALGITADTFMPGSDLGPAVFTFCLGLVFLVIHFRRRHVWWPVIPGGLLCLVALTIQMEEALGIKEPWSVGFFFLGFAAIFGYLYLISNDVNKLTWARYPAVALAGIAVFILVVEGGGTWFAKIILPLGLLTAGVIYIVRAMRARDRE